MPRFGANRLACLRCGHASGVQQKGSHQSRDVADRSVIDFCFSQEGLDFGGLREEDHGEIPFSLGERSALCLATKSYPSSAEKRNLNFPKSKHGNPSSLPVVTKKRNFKTGASG
jgi:hypothetical protein